MKERYVLIARIVIVLVVCSVLAIFWSRQMHDEAKTSNVQGVAVERPQVGLVVERDASLQETQQNEQETQAGQLWKLTQPSNSTQPFTISAYYEQGASLKKLTALTKKPLKEAVLDNVERQLQQQYPEYKEINKIDLTVNSTEATEIVFTYVSQRVKVKQRLRLLFKNSDTVIYIRAQAKANEFDQLSRQYFDQIFESAKFE